MRVLMCRLDLVTRNSRLTEGASLRSLLEAVRHGVLNEAFRTEPCTEHHPSKHDRATCWRYHTEDERMSRLVPKQHICSFIKASLCLLYASQAYMQHSVRPARLQDAAYADSMSAFGSTIRQVHCDCAMSRLQESLPCPDGEHCAYAHDVNELDVQLINKALTVQPLPLRNFSKVLVVNQTYSLRSQVHTKPGYLAHTAPHVLFWRCMLSKASNLPHSLTFVAPACRNGAAARAIVSLC